MRKLKVGFFSFTCCEGCVLSFIELLNKKFFDYSRQLDITYLRPLKSSAKISKMDVAFVEGAISTKSELDKLLKIRKHANKLIALGFGAINGWPSNLRNSLPPNLRQKIKQKLSKQLPKIQPISSYVEIDGKIPGCPVQESAIEKKINLYLKNAQL